MIHNEIEYIINMLTVYIPSTPHFSSQVVVPMRHATGGDTTGGPPSAKAPLGKATRGWTRDAMDEASASDTDQGNGVGGTGWHNRET